MTEKNKGGRPSLYESIEAVEEIIDKYFTGCSEEKEFPTISGLALALDMTTETLRVYGEKDEFSATIKKAKQKVEMAWEQRLLTPGSGPIFWLKNNANWRDKHEVEHSGEVGLSERLSRAIERKKSDD